MNQLIKITHNENNDQVVSARELHKVLGVKTRFSLWWEQNTSLLVEGEDFTSVVSTTVVNNGANRKLQDYAVTADNAKHLAMQSQTKKSREIRDYFIQVEKEFKKHQQIPTTQRELAQLALAANEETAQRMDVVESKLHDLEENKLITTEDKGTIDSYVRKKVSTICRDQHLDSEARSLLFQDLGSSIKKLFNVPNRGRIKDKDFLQVLDFVSTWEPSSVTKAKINQLHIQ
ncbi:toxin-antitoxin system, toxin component, Bro family protein [Lactococcus garvieae subsp. garvieae]|uniref:antA/AntB antirepressor family protein n=1 Tax=Lactococcus garvieae TaxID=1363 RepID=UPI0005A795F9|nr:antA/AntB antirepressor family protein [Lactococcus garvieae]KAA8718793.1 toxin-antitoxin system, toxin component, Bro family protein [Lactococcus garvieae subsp. garvieae]MDG6191169.1 antA/AntB antirepressor family protein [Lactococcus garvieae]PCS00319.1 toxin-antitoxin system, toxin component, Bro family [Lactococcus garvieae]QPR49004.1 ORF6C domain-containing protein [Lactococcus garvieae]